MTFEATHNGGRCLAPGCNWNVVSGGAYRMYLRHVCPQQIVYSGTGAYH